MLKVERKAVYACLFHPPLVVGTCGEDKVAALHSILVDLAVGRGRTNERHIPTALLNASLHLTSL